ncbi:hypothetical protein DPMN_170337 [Dreissena polymorpha]|uniref:Endonuclease/exonuclease/phosphatase domain-containing protein n=1 Tax=Dreissena polymorpha TaxID=45954 RepID=A0A9D4DYE0_DREPO|nr:hypothetical protein DPMN_170337 [Dreissena polymorpha]
MNAKSKLWGNIVENMAGDILETFRTSNFIYLNDGIPTRRYSPSVIDMILVTPELVKNIPRWETLTQENVRSDHISLHVELEDGLQRYNNETIEKYLLNKTNWSRRNEITKERFGAWNVDIQLICK